MATKIEASDTGLNTGGLDGEIRTIDNVLPRLEYQARQGDPDAVSILEATLSRRRHFVDMRDTLRARGSELEALFDSGLRFASVPNVVGLDSWRNMKRDGVALEPVTPWPVSGPEELQDIVDGRKRSPLLTIYSEQYLRLLLDRRVPVPHTEPYWQVVDGPGDSTPFGERIGVRRRSRTSIADAEAALERSGDELFRGLALPAGAGYLRLETAREGLTLAALRRGSSEGATHTKLRGTDGRLVRRGDRLEFASRHNVGVSPNLVLAFGRPLTRTDYLPRNGNGNGKKG